MTDDSKMYKLRWSARARAREGAVAYRNIRTGESVNVSKIWDTSPTCWARSKFEFPALDFLLPMGDDVSKPHCHVRDVPPCACPFDAPCRARRFGNVAPMESAARKNAMGGRV